MPPDPRAVSNLTAGDLVLKRRRLLRELRTSGPLRPLRIAVLGGTTTNELVEFLEVHLLANGFDPIFYQSEYARFEQDALVDSTALLAFRPEIVYLHTCYRNVLSYPTVPCTEEDHQQHLQGELARFRAIWNALWAKLACQVIQNNFELPPYAALGNLDAVASGGLTRFLLDLNAGFAAEARTNSHLLLQDLHSISGRIGLDRWFDWSRWYSYKILYTPEANLALARSLNAILNSIYGRSSKVLVLDLDNTLWGGTIGDDGVNRIEIGRETPVAESFTAFQEYCLEQRRRGVLLAVCSKNDEEIARQGFAHPDSVLKLEHFSAFKANWTPKHENLLRIASELNLGLDSFVFVDDNPAERHIVRSQLPAVHVPEVGSDVSEFIRILDAGRYFEPVSLSQEDFARSAVYANKSETTALESRFANYGEYLDSLQMIAEIAPFRSVYLDRITQLTNKTNQFNLTTRRCTLAEMQSFAADPDYITLYGRLKDRFGDNGLITVVIGRRQGSDLNLDLWLMSCRVLKRDIELAVLDALAARALAAGLTRLVGVYIPTRKNGMVADLYSRLGFTKSGEQPGGHTCWLLDLASYVPCNTHIELAKTVPDSCYVGATV